MALRTAPLDLYTRAWSDISEMDDVMLFTWNCSDRFMRGAQGYNAQWAKMCLVLSKFHRCARNYAFVAEVSLKGRLHCHGFYVLKDKVKFIKGVLPHLKANGNFSQGLAKTHDWKAFVYHTKDMEVTVELIQEHPIILTEETLKYFMTMFSIAAAQNYARKETKRKRRVNKDLSLWFGRLYEENNLFNEGYQFDDLDDCTGN